MKKAIVILVAFVMAILVVAGCAAPKQDEADIDGAEIANPLKEYDSLEDLADSTGIMMKIPRASELVLAQSIDGKVNEAVFKLDDGSEYTYRKAKSDFEDINGKDDISGFFTEWNDEHGANTSDGIAVTVKTGDPENAGAGLVVWNDGEYKYSISVNDGFDEGMLLAAADSVQ